jgi:hypothetical protein
MVSFDDINAGDTVLLVPDFNYRGSAVKEFCELLGIKQHASVVVGKSRNNTLAILSPGYESVGRLCDYKHTFALPEAIYAIYADSFIYGVGPNQLLKIEKVNADISNFTNNSNEDNGGLSLL